MDYIPPLPEKDHSELIESLEEFEKSVVHDAEEKVKAEFDIRRTPKYENLLKRVKKTKKPIWNSDDKMGQPVGATVRIGWARYVVETTDRYPDSRYRNRPVYDLHELVESKLFSHSRLANRMARARDRARKEFRTSLYLLASGQKDSPYVHDQASKSIQAAVELALAWNSNIADRHFIAIAEALSGKSADLVS